MDKKRLNNEIILCRPAVRKARVAVIRKILKKMKILKSCKLETLKEKKLQKCERLFQKVQIMKKLKDDEVTKFALRIKNLDTFLREPKLNLKQNALGYLAKHEAVSKKINFIRELIPNWETELPALLNSLGKKKKKKLKDKTEIMKTDNKTGKSNSRVPSKNKDIKVKKNVKKNEVVLKEMRKLTERKHEFHSFNQKDIENDGNKESKKTCSAEERNEKIIKIEKVDDPFFVDKKVIASKLMLETLSTKKDSIENLDKNWIKKETNSLKFHMKPFKAKKDSYKSMTQKPEAKEEKLHPSWTAKKVKLIQPFEGKKIKFSDN